MFISNILFTNFVDFALKYMLEQKNIHQNRSVSPLLDHPLAVASIGTLISDYILFDGPRARSTRKLRKEKQYVTCTCPMPHCSKFHIQNFLSDNNFAEEFF